MSSRALASRPTPRSRSIGRTKDGEDSVRLPLPSGPRMTPSQSRANRLETPRGRMVEETTTSLSASSLSGSSIFDRTSARGSEKSSRGSLDDLYEDRRRGGGGGWAPSRSKKPINSEEEQFDEEESYQDSDPTKQLAGYGYDLWSRVTAVAGNLTVNVSKAWEKGISTVDGEETPPGQESRLTKAMKAYHLDRARSPADLPAWLFDEHERGTATRSWNAPSRTKKDESYEDRFMPDGASQQRSGLRDVYDRAAASSPSIPTSSRRVNEAGGASGGAANRLKAIREAKRSGMSQTRPEAPVEDFRQAPQRGEERRSESTGVRSPRPRVGLPAGPGSTRRL